MRCADHDESDEKGHRKSRQNRNPPGIKKKSQADSCECGEQRKTADDREDATAIPDTRSVHNYRCPDRRYATEERKCVKTYGHLERTGWCRPTR